MRQALLAVAFLSACSAQKNLQPPGDLSSAPLPEASELLEALAHRRASLVSIRGLARASYTAPEQSLRSKQLLIAERPDRLRLDVLSPFSTVFVVAAREGRLAAYDPGEKTVYRGAASMENLARYTQVALPLEVLVDVLMATPRMHAGEPGVVSFDEGLVELWQDAEDDIRVAWFNQTLQPIRYEQRDSDGHVLFRADYPQYEPGGDVSLPSRVHFELPQEKRRIEIKLTDMEVNPALDDAVFAVDTPAGSQEIELDEAAW